MIAGTPARSGPCIRVSKQFTFDMAHALAGHDGPCRHIHGHTYTLVVTLIGQAIAEVQHPKLGMVIDFAELKKLVQENIIAQLDHSLLLNEQQDAYTLHSVAEHGNNIRYVNYQPSCENLLSDIVSRLLPLLPPDVQLHSVHLHETPTSCAGWFAADQADLCAK